MDPVAHVRAGWSQGELRVQHCQGCGAKQCPPRAVCLACRSARLGWSTVAPRGTVASFTVVHRAPTPEWKARVPYAIALVDFAPGVRMMMNVDGAFDALAIGAAVDVGFAASLGDSQVRPVARVATAAAPAG